MAVMRCSYAVGAVHRCSEPRDLLLRALGASHSTPRVGARAPVATMGHEEVALEDDAGGDDAQMRAKRAQMMVRARLFPPPSVRSFPRSSRWAPSHRASPPLSFPSLDSGAPQRHRREPPRGRGGAPRGGGRRGGPAGERARVPRVVRVRPRRGGAIRARGARRRREGARAGRSASRAGRGAVANARDGAPRRGGVLLPPLVRRPRVRGRGGASQGRPPSRGRGPPPAEEVRLLVQEEEESLRGR